MDASPDRVSLRVLSWNLFHGRDRPPDPSLYTRRSRWCRRSERGALYAQVNRSLLPEFSAALARDRWDVALLQEVPPRWLGPLCRATGAAGASALTARFFGMSLRGRLADFNPDLIGAWEGGSNQLLVRPPWRIQQVRRLTLAREPQRRRTIGVLAREPRGASVAIGNVHLSVHDRTAAALEAELAAADLARWSGEGPMVLGGDFNLRPKSSPELFDLLERRFGLAGACVPGGIDHLLASGVQPSPTASPRPDDWREPLDIGTGLRLRLSDHAPVVAEFAVPARRVG